MAAGFVAKSINLDGAVFKESGEAGLGIIARTSQGLVLASLAKKITFPPSVDD